MYVYISDTKDALTLSNYLINLGGEGRGRIVNLIKLRVGVSVLDSK